MYEKLKKMRVSEKETINMIINLGKWSTQSALVVSKIRGHI
jgi:hypothetical protein